MPHALSLPTCRNLWRNTTAYQARMGPRMAENPQSVTRPYDDVVVICRGMRQSVVKALTSELGQEPLCWQALPHDRFVIQDQTLHFLRLGQLPHGLPLLARHGVRVMF